MPFTALKKILLDRHLDGRDFAALILLVIVVSAFASVYLDYRHSQHALRIAEGARSALRQDRKTTEIKLCRAVNLNRSINNRDRNTLVRSRRATMHDLKVVTDPILRGLLRRSLVETNREISIRPFLHPINCTALIHKPKQTQVPGVTTTTSG